MSQAHCPRCGDPVRLPSDLPAEAVVRCPLCTEEYSYSEIESKLPPLLEVISLPETELSGIDRIDELLAAKPAAAAPALVSPPRVSTGTTGSKSSYRRPTESPWRPLILLVEIALSGVVGIGLAVLVLWWLPGQWHRDPLQLKPVALKYAPWLLPPKHRPASELNAATEDGMPVAKPKFGQNEESEAEKPKAARRPSRFDPPEEISPVKELRPGESAAAMSESLESANAADEKATPALPEKEPQNAAEWLNQEEPPPEPPELTWTTSPDIIALVRDAERRRTATVPAPAIFPDIVEPDFVATFRELARVAGQVSAEDVAIEVARARLMEWLSGVKGDEWKRACEATAKDVDKPSIAPRGVVYLAKLKAAEAEGSWLHLELEPAPGSPTFPVLIEPQLFHSLSGDSLVGHEVYVLGSELPDPKRLVVDVPGGVKKTWLIGAIVKAEQATATGKAAF